ncbi:hypothetical protein NPX13_g5536 [Xylaria arbuscula]|uniref:Uncharacterized protein n=1 Tax=Xylaria arbuscula TaxID=114810 RepID=A0A9W8NDY9_9PEZI|nr:hypothetical protein NPX13_g5536 [Xylaria arbuscula]
MASYTLLNEDQPVPQAWFDAQADQSQGKPHQQAALATLKSFHDEYIKILKSYHDGNLTAGEAANMITRPISTSPVPELGDYSDHATALCRLWRLLVRALIEWPSSRTPDLVSLLTAISRVPDNIHRGEVFDDTANDVDKPLTWRSLPWLIMVWSDKHWMQPGMITRRAPDEATRHRPVFFSGNLLIST